MNNNNYAYGIDALRFLSAILVTVFHLTYRSPEGAWTMPFGWVGVQIFFVISGVVIANSANGADPKRFVSGRFLRLYPAAWIAAVVNFSIILLIPLAAYKAQGINVVPQLGAFLRSLTLVGDYFLSSSYWTLPVELAFYLVILVSLCARRWVTLIMVARALIILACPYLIALIFHELGFANLPWLDLGYGLKNMLLVRHGPFFALGIYIWWYVEGRSLKRVDAILVALALVLAAIEIAAKAMELIDLYPVTAYGPMNLKFLILSSIGTFALFVYGIFMSMRFRTAMNLTPKVKATLRGAGLVTYPLYLLHEALGGFALHYIQADMAPFHVRVVLAILLAFLAAYIVSAFAEPWLRQQLRKPMSISWFGVQTSQGLRE